jgi:hypothetical protein
MVSAKGLPTVAFGSYTHASRVTWGSAGAPVITGGRGMPGRISDGADVGARSSKATAMSLYLCIYYLSICR